MKDIGDLLNRDDKAIEDAKNPAAILFRQIAIELNLTSNKWNDKLNRYLEETDGGGLSKDKRVSEKNNINRSLVMPSITWKKFRKVLDILKPRSISYELSLKWDPDLVFGKEKPDSIKYKSIGRYDDLKMLFRKVLTSVVDSPIIWEKLVNRWIDKQDPKTKNNPADRSTERGNIQKTIISKDSLTLDVFVKALNIVGIIEAELKIHLHWPNKLTTTHKYVFNVEEVINGNK